VDEKQVDVVELELAQRLVECAACVVRHVNLAHDVASSSDVFVSGSVPVAGLAQTTI
jgi:hypothetical protein